MKTDNTKSGNTIVSGQGTIASGPASANHSDVLASAAPTAMPTPAPSYAPPGSNYGPSPAPASVAEHNARVLAAMQSRQAALEAENARLATELAAARSTPAPSAAPQQPTPEQQELVKMMRLLKETRQQLDDLQRQQAAASPGTPLATLAPAPVTEDEANRYIAMFENASVGRTVLGLFLPLLAAAGVGSGVWWLTSWALATVAMASSFILWPILIIVAAVVVGAMLMWKVAGMTGSYILTGKADQHAATVWGWVSSPFRSVEVKHAVKQVEAKVDRLQAGLA